MRKEIELMIEVNDTNVAIILEKLNKVKPTIAEIKAFINGYRLGKVVKQHDDSLCNTCNVECDIRFHQTKNESHGTYVVVTKCGYYNKG